MGKRGPKALSPGVKKSKFIQIRVNDREDAIIRKNAMKAGMQISEFGRNLMLSTDNLFNVR